MPGHVAAGRSSASADHQTLLLKGRVDSPSVVARLRCYTSGIAPTTASSASTCKADNSSIFYLANSAIVLTGDGADVVFTSNDNDIVAGDSDSQFDVFIRHPGGETGDGQRQLRRAETHRVSSTCSACQTTGDTC